MFLKQIVVLEIMMILNTLLEDYKYNDSRTDQNTPYNNGVLMSNFAFLNNGWSELYATAREAEQHVNSAPRTSCFYARRSLERAVKWLYTNDSYLKQPYADNLAALIHEPTFRENLEPCLFPKIPFIHICKIFFTSGFNAIYSTYYA